MLLSITWPGQVVYKACIGALESLHLALLVLGPKLFGQNFTHQIQSSHFRSPFQHHS